MKEVIEEAQSTAQTDPRNNSHKESLIDILNNRGCDLDIQDICVSYLQFLSTACHIFF